jgi:hypothetical protein
MPNFSHIFDRSRTGSASANGQPHAVPPHRMASLRLVATLAPSGPPPPPRRKQRRLSSAVRLTGGMGLAAAAAVAAAAAASPPALAALSEPANALSLPTWAVHVSSVAEWCRFSLLPASNNCLRACKLCEE